MQCFMVQTDGAGAPEVEFPTGEAALNVQPGDRVLFYQLRGEAGATRGVFVAWGEVERLGTRDDHALAYLRTVTPLRRRVPFSELRADPRRRDAAIQPVSPEVFNQVLARARR